MKNWWIVVLAVAGLALGLLLIPRPDTGGDVNPPERVAPPQAPVGPVDEGIPLRSGPRLGNEVAQQERQPGGNPHAIAAREARETPETRTSAKVQSGWMQVIRLLGDHVNSNPEAQALQTEVHTLETDLRDLRRNPQNYNWKELDDRQQSLLQRIRALGLGGQEMDQALVHIEAQLAAHHEDAAGSGARAPMEPGPGAPPQPDDGYEDEYE